MDFAPEVPKTQPDLLVSTLHSAKTTYEQLAEYLKTGSVDAARKAANSLLFMSAARTRGPFAVMLGSIIRGEHPLTDDQRAEAKEEVDSRGTTDL
jgi:hypothetical protein